MTLLVDTGGLYALVNRADPFHHAVAEAIQTERSLLVTTEAVATEADYLILSRLGVDAELAFLQDHGAGTISVECLSREELGTAHQVALRYRSLSLGLADTSLVVLAQRFRTARILTLDQRAFRTVAPLQGGAFTVLPFDT